MNTQSHAILTTVLLRLGFGQRLARVPHLNATLICGAIFPDLPLYLFFGWYSWFDVRPQAVIWNELYFASGWQNVINASHSFPLWGLLALVAWRLRRMNLALFSLAALCASAEDFLLHHDDAHAHFWPLSDYRFVSPVSYWDPAHFGGVASLVEVLLVLAAAIWLWPRLSSRWGRGLLVLAVLTLLGNHGLWALLLR